MPRNPGECRAGALVSVATAAFLFGCASGPSPTGVELDTVTITVVDENGRPVAGAEVRGPAGAARSDASGKARLLWSRTSHFRGLRVTAAGYANIDTDWHGCDQSLTLQPEEVLRVRVLDADTELPLGGARISDLYQFDCGVTDANGCAELHGQPPPGAAMPELRVFRWRDAFHQRGHWGFRRFGSPSVGLTREGDTYVVRLRSEPLSEFVLRAATGQAFAPSTRVMVDGREVPFVRVDDGGGSLRCRLPASGSMYPIVEVPGHAPWVAFAPNGAEEPIVVELEPGIRLRGRVVEPNGAIEGAQVWLTWSFGAIEWRRNVRTDANGEWSVDDVPGEPDWVGVSALGYVPVGSKMAASVDSAVGKNASMTVGDVRLDREHVVVARLDASWPRDPLQFWISPRDRLAVTAVAVASPDGRLVIRGLTSGEHRLNWRVGDGEHHLDFAIDDTTRILDLGTLAMLPNPVHEPSSSR
jgi:hypothetical protein